MQKLYRLKETWKISIGQWRITREVRWKLPSWESSTATAQNFGQRACAQLTSPKSNVSLAMMTIQIYQAITIQEWHKTLLSQWALVAQIEQMMLCLSMTTMVSWCQQLLAWIDLTLNQIYQKYQICQTQFQMTNLNNCLMSQFRPIISRTTFSKFRPRQTWKPSRSKC